MRTNESGIVATQQVSFFFIFSPFFHICFIFHKLICVDSKAFCKNYIGPNKKLKGVISVYIIYCVPLNFFLFLSNFFYINNDRRKKGDSTFSSYDQSSYKSVNVKSL